MEFWKVLYISLKGRNSLTNISIWRLICPKAMIIFVPIAFDELLKLKKAGWLTACTEYELRQIITKTSKYITKYLQTLRDVKGFSIHSALPIFQYRMKSIF